MVEDHSAESIEEPKEDHGEVLGLHLNSQGSYMVLPYDSLLNVDNIESDDSSYEDEEGEPSMNLDEEVAQILWDVIEEEEYGSDESESSKYLKIG